MSDHEPPAPEFDPSLDADAITWTLDSLPRLELLPIDDLVALDFADILEYARELQLELQAVRATLHEALDALTRAQVQRERALTRVSYLIDELRLAREPR